jgi:hypothetical protein
MFARLRKADPRPAEEVIREQREHDALAEAQKRDRIETSR